MTLRPDDLAPALAAHLAAARKARPAPTASQRQGRILAGVGLTLLGYFGGMVFFGFLVGPDSRHPHVPNLVLAPVFLGLLWGIPYAAVRWVRKGLTSDGVQPERSGLARPALEALLAEDGLTEAEAAYTRNVLLLLELAEGRRLDEGRARELLGEMNALLAADADLARQEGRLRAVVDEDAIRQDETERAALAERKAAATDAGARAALESALAACETRLQNARELHGRAERVVAERESAVQTLRTLESSLVRLRVSPQGGDGDTLELQRLQETIASFNRESRSAEQAIQELTGP